MVDMEQPCDSQRMAEHGMSIYFPPFYGSSVTVSRSVYATREPPELSERTPFGNDSSQLLRTVPAFLSIRCQIIVVRDVRALPVRSTCSFARWLR